MEQHPIDYVTCPLDDCPDQVIAMLADLMRHGRVTVKRYSLGHVTAVFVANRWPELYDLDVDDDETRTLTPRV